MSYQVLARKWRPKSFSEMAGQEHVLQALINALDNDRLHHAYLFTGTRGVGKTTIGRIMAKCLNCEIGVSSVPCGKCTSCCEVDEGRFIDLIEVDAASRTGVDDMRDLLNNVQYAPSRGRFKIYLIDEVHMLSKQSFAALLKTLEEPPAHVKFLFATTDPQKLPITVLSRCLQFNLKNLSVERITGHLKFVLEQENIAFDDAGILALGRAADGSMRDALSLTDQAIGHGAGKIHESDVTSMLGTIDRRYVVDICQAMASQHGPDLLAAIATMAEQSPDYDLVLADILSFWHQVAILQTVPDAVDTDVEHFKVLVDIAGNVSREDVQLFYQICLLGRKDQPLAPDQRSGFEMVMLRAMAFRPASKGRPTNTAETPVAVESSVKKSDAGAEDILIDVPVGSMNDVNNSHMISLHQDDGFESESLSRILDHNVVKGEASVGLADDKNNENKTENDQNHKAPWASESTGVRSGSNNLIVKPSSNTSKRECFSITDDAVGGMSSNKPLSSIYEKIALDQFSPLNWITVRGQLSIGSSLGEIASHCLYEGRDGNHLEFLIDQQHNSLFDENHQIGLAAALSDYFGHLLEVIITSGVTEQETPRAVSVRKTAERQAEAVNCLDNDPAVIKFKETFGGSIDESS
ncbi:MAG: DNA polymerase III subunit gamma/tau, partial [Porticoccaceae bacterium]|nr:DNA polymerase III subunit gamma/tau [Porticoccaceae bacterium]